MENNSEIIDWATVREKYKKAWVLVEALESRSEYGKRVVTKLLVIDSYPDCVHGLEACKDLHGKEPEKELYIASTRKIRLEIIDLEVVGFKRKNEKY